jgi:hypothetical protein
MTWHGGNSSHAYFASGRASADAERVANAMARPPGLQLSNYDLAYQGNRALGHAFEVLRAYGIFDGQHQAEKLPDGKLRHTVTWDQDPSLAGT